MVKESSFEEKVSYVLGLASILLAISLLSPLGGIVAGIMGLYINDNKSELGKRARRVNKWGIFCSAVIIILLIVFVFIDVSGKIAKGAIPLQ